jgi:hypothetical protein
VYHTYTPPTFQHLPGTHPSLAQGGGGQVSASPHYPGNRPQSQSQGNINPQGAAAAGGPGPGGRPQSYRSGSMPYNADPNQLAQAPYNSNPQQQQQQQQQQAPPMYAPPQEPIQPKKFTKYYRFSVAAPVEMSSTSRMLGGYALVEVSVRNVTPNVRFFIFIECERIVFFFLYVCACFFSSFFFFHCEYN